MKYGFILITLSTLLGFMGCGYKEGVVTSEQKSYLYFTGNTKNITVYVDNGEGFSVESGNLHLYKINVGKHLITINRGNDIIVKREIFISDGITKEIEVQP